MNQESFQSPIGKAARRPVKVFIVFAVFTAFNCLAMWLFWPEQTNWLIRGVGICMLVMAVFFFLVLVSPSPHEKLNKL